MQADIDPPELSVKGIAYIPPLPFADVASPVEELVPLDLDSTEIEVLPARIPTSAVAGFELETIPSAKIHEPPQAPWNVPKKKMICLTKGFGAQAKKVVTGSSRQSWLPELAALFTAFICCICIAIVLRVYEGSGVAELNLPSRLTLNGVVAVIATFLRVSLLVPVASALNQEVWLWLRSNARGTHPRSQLGDIRLSDAAARGTWGSLQLLLTTRPRLGATLGAIITVLSLTIGISSQQLILTEILPVSDRNSPLKPGNIPRTEKYVNTHGRGSQGTLNVNLDMKAAIYNGFMGEDIQEVKPNCPTTNCTFPTTPSIAVCGACSETTNDLGGCDDTYCNYTTSTAKTFSVANFEKTFIGTGFQVAASNINPQADAVFAQFEMLGLPFGMKGYDVYPGRPAMTSSACELWLCLNLYSTSVVSGVLHQTAVDSTRKVPGATSTYTGGDSWAFTVPSNWTAANEVISAAAPPIDYTVDASSWNSLYNAFLQLATGTIELTGQGYTLGDGSGDGIEGIWAGTQDQQKWIRNVVTSLTNVAKTGSQTERAQRDEYNGTGYQLGIVVQWWWFTLPVGLLLAAVVLLVITIFRSTEAGIGTLKGDPLNLLLLDVDDSLRQYSVAEELNDKIAILSSGSSRSWRLGAR